MTRGRLLRLLLSCLFWQPLCALAVSQIEIHAGQVEVPGATVGDFSAILQMDGRWQGTAVLRQGDLARLAQDYPLPVKVGQGQIKGRAAFSGAGSELRRISLDADVSDAAFSDAGGLRAGDKLGGHLTAEAERAGSGWNWSAAADWKAGEVYWQPLYIANGGVSFHGRGTLTDAWLTLAQGRLALAGVGEAALAGQWRRSDNLLQSFDVDARNLDAAAAYAQLIQPFMGKSLLGNLDMAGRLDMVASMREGALSAFDIALHDLDLADKGGRFALYKVDARVPWSMDHPTAARLHYDGGQLLNLPLGKTDLAATLYGYSLTAPAMRLPVLDGELALTGVSAALLQNEWYWHLSASLSPVSMVDFSHAVGWPVMQGKVALGIPLLTYRNGQLSSDGAIGFDLFDGSVVVRNLALQHPLSIAPRLQADIRMRNIDLELLTRTFSFGAMTGRLDGDVEGMELSRWQPVRFDADFHSSPGSYPKKISQRAVENISALGGAGAAAAIQRSFLRFFKEFNYARIGLSCRLRNGVCAMDGVESTSSGYVIVKGSGIPAITVLGYNHNVSWDVLLQRIQRVIQGNVSPVIE
ncbi:hypothetical protein GALL_310190 [mine drainage metagenome]|uniref:Dicarboxylate transport domain-containing protein n=1 Tax=mine drainage metagenome TaxID=410659 RepID=A0A1J5RBT7_9ZZZZ